MAVPTITSIATASDLVSATPRDNFTNIAASYNDLLRYSGTQTSGAALTAYAPVYLNVTDARWYHARANALTTLAQGMVIAAATGAAETITVYHGGIHTNAGWAWAADPTRPIYVDPASAGGLVQPASGALPSTTAGQFSQVVGVPITATAILLNLSPTSVSLATVLENDEIEALRGITATTTELNYLAGVTPGTAAASKVAILGTNKNLDALVLAASGLSIGAGAGTAVTATAAELNYNAGVTAGTSAASKAVVLSATSKINALDITTLTINGTAVTSTATNLNLLAGLTALPAITIESFATTVSGAGTYNTGALAAEPKLAIIVGVARLPGSTNYSSFFVGMATGTGTGAVSAGVTKTEGAATTSVTADADAVGGSSGSDTIQTSWQQEELDVTVFSKAGGITLDWSLTGTTPVSVYMKVIEFE